MKNEFEMVECFMAMNEISLTKQDFEDMKRSMENNIVKRYILGMRFIDNTIDSKIDYIYLRLINDLISLDKLMINREHLEKDLTALLKEKDINQRVGKVLAYLIRKKCFKSNNIETSLLFVNAILLQETGKMLIVPKNFIHTFFELLEEDESLFIEFISHFCIQRSLF